MIHPFRFEIPAQGPRHRFNNVQASCRYRHGEFSIAVKANDDSHGNSGRFSLHLNRKLPARATEHNSVLHCATRRSRCVSNPDRKSRRIFETAERTGKREKKEKERQKERTREGGRNYYRSQPKIRKIAERLFLAAICDLARGARDAVHYPRVHYAPGNSSSAGLQRSRCLAHKHGRMVLSLNTHIHILSPSFSQRPNKPRLADLAHHQSSGIEDEE